MNDIVSLAALSQRFEADNRSLPTIVILQGGASKKHDVRQKKKRSWGLPSLAIKRVANKNIISAFLYPFPGKERLPRSKKLWSPTPYLGEWCYRVNLAHYYTTLMQDTWTWSVTSVGMEQILLALHDSGQYFPALWLACLSSVHADSYEKIIRAIAGRISLWCLNSVILYIPWSQTSNDIWYSLLDGHTNLNALQMENQGDQSRKSQLDDR